MLRKKGGGGERRCKMDFWCIRLKKDFNDKKKNSCTQKSSGTLSNVNDGGSLGGSFCAVVAGYREKPGCSRRPIAIHPAC